MPGMNSGLNLNAPAVVEAFKTLLLHQGIIALLIFASLALAWVSARAWLGVPAGQASALPGEIPGGRRSGSASARCGWSTGSCRPSRAWRSACHHR